MMNSPQRDNPLPMTQQERHQNISAIIARYTTQSDYEPITDERDIAEKTTRYLNPPRHIIHQLNAMQEAPTQNPHVESVRYPVPHRPKIGPGYAQRLQPIPQHTEPIAPIQPITQPFTYPVETLVTREDYSIEIIVNIAVNKHYCRLNCMPPSTFIYMNPLIKILLECQNITAFQFKGCRMPFKADPTLSCGTVRVVSE